MTPDVNLLAIAVAALVPNIVGALYYGPLFGGAWRAALGKTKAELKPTNEALVYGSALLLSVCIAFFLNFMIGMSHREVGDAGQLIFSSPRTFGHGAFHGTAISLLLVAPIITCLGLFHRYTAKVILLNVAYWVLCLAIMGGIVDLWV